MTHLENKVKDYIEKHSLLDTNDKVIVALSGGADSVSLLLMLQSLHYDCHAVHCNFHLRGEESERDEQFATDLCKRLNIPIHKIDFDTETYSRNKGISIEMGARELRYDYFHKLKEEIGAAVIAVGHHRDDNIETLFLNLVRGTGIQGLCGIQPKNGDIIRPLLCISREDILAYLEDKHQDYVTDSTNLQDMYSRNKIRLNVLPELQDINIGAMENIRTTISNLNEVRKIYEAAVKADIERCCTDCMNNSKTKSISIAELTKCTSPTSVLHEIIYPLGFNKSQEADIYRAIQSGSIGQMFLSSTHTLTIDRTSIAITEKQEDFTTPVPVKDFPQIEMTLLTKEECTIIRDKAYAFVDSAKLKGDLIVRQCAKGDTFMPFGMKGRKLLSDYMTDRKFNRIQKASQLVLCDSDGEIVWLIGERASEKYRIDDNSTHILMLHYIQ